MSVQPRPDEPRLGADEVGGPRFWICAALGGGVIAFGLIGLLGDPRAGSLTSWLTFLLGGLFLHDGVLAPAVVGASVTLALLAPRRVRPALQVTAFIAGMILLVAIPVVGTWGELPGNPSLLPRDYGAGLAVALGIVLLTGAVAAMRALRRASPPETDEPRGW